MTSIMRQRFVNAFRAMREAKTFQEYFAPGGGMLHIERGDCFRVHRDMPGLERNRIAILALAAEARRQRFFHTARSWLQIAHDNQPVRLP